MRYISALIVGFQLMIACSSTQKLAQPAPAPVIMEPVVEKQVEIPDPVIETIEKKDTVPPPALKIDTLVSVYYGPCYGKCEVYSISITNDGLVYWHGYKNVSKPGSYLTKLTLPQKEQLESWLTDSAIGELSNTYPDLINFIADFPVRKYTLKYNNQTRQVEINHSPPPIIAQLESNLQSWLSQVDWRRIDDK